MTHELSPRVELPTMTMSFAEILAHDAYRVASITLVTGETHFVNDANRTLELGDGWCIVRVGHGEGERLEVIRYAAIASVTLR